jgi:predicted aspartyl protease
LFLSSCASTTTIPLTVDADTGYYMLLTKYEKRKAVFLLDTGTALPAISRRFVEAHGFSTTRRQWPADSLFDGKQTDSAPIESTIVVTSPTSFSVGRATVDPLGYFQVLNLAPLSSAIDDRVDGIFGSGILNGTLYTIDFRKRTLTLGRSKQPVELPFKIEFERQRPLVDATVNGAKIVFVLDTGAMYTSISHRTAARLLDESSIGEEASYLLLSVDGLRPAKLRRATIDRLEFAGVELENFTVFIGDHDLIGLDILRNGILTVDASAGRYSFRHGTREAGL